MMTRWSSSDNIAVWVKAVAILNELLVGQYVTQRIGFDLKELTVTLDHWDP